MEPAGQETGPTGRCRACGYPMDPGRCPECGRVFADVSVPASPDRRPLAVMVAAAASPLAWVALIAVGSRVGVRLAARGTRPGEAGIAHAAREAYRLGSAAYLYAAPPATLLAVGLIVVWAARRWARAPERRPWGGAALLALDGAALALAAWSAGFVPLALAVWTI